MGAQPETIATIYVITERGAYRDVFTTSQAEAIAKFGDDDSGLESLLNQLLLHWRACAYQATLHSSWVYSRPEAANLEDLGSNQRLLTFSELLLHVLVKEVPQLDFEPNLRAQIKRLALDKAVEYQETFARIDHDAMLDQAWRSMMESPAFQLYVWYAQRSSWMFAFAAYENFLVALSRLAGFTGRLRVTQGDFQDRVASVLDVEVVATCWTVEPVKGMRDVRNALAHRNGAVDIHGEREVNGIRVQGRQYHVTVDDVRALLDSLSTCVAALSENFLARER